MTRSDIKSTKKSKSLFSLTEKLLYENIIGLEKAENNESKCKIHFIQDHPSPNYKLTAEVLEFITDDSTFNELQRTIQGKITTGNDI